MQTGLRNFLNSSKQRRVYCFFFSSRRRHTRLQGDWSSDVCSSDLPGGVGIRNSASNSGHSPLRGLGGGLGGGLGDASPARRGSRSRPPLRRPRPLRFERLRVRVWNPYSRGRLSPAKSEDRKGGEGKTDANLTNFLSTCSASSRRARAGGNS